MAEKKKSQTTQKKREKKEKQQDIKEIFTTSPNKEKVKKTKNKNKKDKMQDEKKPTKLIEEKKEEKVLLDTLFNPNTVSINKLYLAIIIMLVILIFAFILINSRIHHIEQMIKPVEPVTYYVNPKTIFFGDSITSNYDLTKYFERNDYINKGIGGNKTTDLLNRMKESIYDYNPSRVILLIGTNDLSKGTPIKEIASNISLIIKKIQKNNVKTEIFVESVLPVNKNEEESDKINKQAVGRRNNQDIQKLNELIQMICEEQGVYYIDAYDEFTDKDGNLKVEYTVEGLHLNDAGYQKQTEVIEQALKIADSKKNSRN